MLWFCKITPAAYAPRRSLPTHGTIGTISVGFRKIYRYSDVMALYEIKSDAIVSIAGTSFGVEHLRERGDLQRLLRANINVVCPDTMVLAEAFCDWDHTRPRIDLPGLAKNANLVVVELKRSEDGGHMELHSSRAEGLVFSMTFEQAVATHTGYLTLLGRP